jgi:hypothetical protein
MNKVFESPTMVVHDDREPLSITQAIVVLWQGLPIRICFPPDFSAENGYDIYDDDYPIFITDIISADKLAIQSSQNSELIIEAYLRGYEIYR